MIKTVTNINEIDTAIFADTHKEYSKLGLYKEKVLQESEFSDDLKNIYGGNTMNNTENTNAESYLSELLQENNKSINFSEGFEEFSDNTKQITEARLPFDEAQDPEFGIPSLKKYPLFDKAHVESAIKLFGHAEARYQAELAKHIKSKMVKFGIPESIVGKENKLFNFIHTSKKLSLKEAMESINNSSFSETLKESLMANLHKKLKQGLFIDDTEPSNTCLNEGVTYVNNSGQVIEGATIDDMNKDLHTCKHNISIYTDAMKTRKLTEAEEKDLARCKRFISLNEK